MSKSKNYVDRHLENAKDLVKLNVKTPTISRLLKVSYQQAYYLRNLALIENSKKRVARINKRKASGIVDKPNRIVKTANKVILNKKDFDVTNKKGNINITIRLAM